MNQGSKNNKRLKIIILSLIVMLVAGLITVVIFIVLDQDKLSVKGDIKKSIFIGYDECEKALGQKIVYFNDLPKNLVVTETIGCDSSNDEITILLDEPTEVSDSRNFITISESKNASAKLDEFQKEDYNGVTYYNHTTDKVTIRLTAFEKNGLWITFATDKSAYSLNELYRIAESAY